jgi:hypothetical protein
MLEEFVLSQIDETRKPLMYVMIRKKDDLECLNLKQSETTEGEVCLPDLNDQVTIISPSENPNNFDNIFYVC